MTDLQADVDLFSGDLAPDPGSPLANIVEAARRVANLDYEAAVEGLVGAFDIPPISAKIMAHYCIDSALGITEDTNA